MEGQDAPQIDLESKAREAIFTVDQPHGEIYLVLVVEKVLQPDVSAVTDAYVKVLKPLCRVPGDDTRVRVLRCHALTCGYESCAVTP